MIVDKIYEIIREINEQGVDDPAGRAERQLRARRLRRAATCWRPDGRADRQLRALRNDERVKAAYLGSMIAMLILAALGAKAFYLLYVWLASAIAASWLSELQGLRREVGPGHRAAARASSA